MDNKKKTDSIMRYVVYLLCGVLLAGYSLLKWNAMSEMKYLYLAIGVIWVIYGGVRALVLAEAGPGISNGRTACGTPCLHLSPQQPQHHTVYHAGGGAEYDHRPGDQEHFGGHAGDQALCLCQDRTHIFLFFSNYRIQSNGNQLFLLKGLSSGLPCNCFYDFLGEIIMTPEVNLYSSIFIDTDLLYQFPKFFWAVPIQKLNTLGICF